MRVKFLASSSSGNCALVEAAEKKFLMDAGLPFRKLEAALAEEGVTPREIDAIFVTHEHSDHTAGLSGFAALNTPVYATRGTALGAANVKGVNWKLIDASARFEAAGLAVEVFSVPHDAADPVGFALGAGEDRLVWALDVGHLNAGLKKILQTATVLVLESNYCPKMLEADKKRPYFLKQRIMGRHGHLSNDETFDFLTSERSVLWREIHLAHLSKQCNNAEALERRYAATGLAINVVDPLGEKVA